MKKQDKIKTIFIKDKIKLQFYKTIGNDVIFMNLDEIQNCIEKMIKENLKTDNLCKVLEIEKGINCKFEFAKKEVGGFNVLITNFFEILEGLKNYVLEKN